MGSVTPPPKRTGSQHPANFLAPPTCMHTHSMRKTTKFLMVITVDVRKKFFTWSTTNADTRDPFVVAYLVSLPVGVS